MELFPAQPDLSLQISPPNSKPTSSWRTADEEMNLFFYRSASDPSKTIPTSCKPGSGFELSLTNPKASEPKTNYQLHGQEEFHKEIGFFRPIRGIPIYQHPPFTFAQKPPLDASSSTITTTSNSCQSNDHTRSRLISRFPTKRSTRAPRMKWTTALHAHFIHAVKLLGGHERATPKSVLELMDVKDLTLAHVKSHLQMYRTIKTTDRPAASSGNNYVPLPSRRIRMWFSRRDFWGQHGR